VGSPRSITASGAGEICAEHLQKAFGATIAVRDVSFEVARGEVIGFLGPNGAGKSTTLRMITGVFPPSSGRCTIAGHDVVREAIHARSAVGYLPERTSLYGDMAVEDYLRFVADMKQIPHREVARAVGRSMAAAGIEHVAHRLVGNLSKGYRQRVGIAQAVLGDPPVLILDEPTSGLDPEQVSEIRALIRALGDEKRTVVLSTHILPEVEMICSRVIILAGGRILAVDEPANLERRLRPFREYSVRLAMPTPDVLAKIGALPHVAEVASRERDPLSVPHSSAADGTEVIVRVEHGFDMRREIAATAVGSEAGLIELRPVVMTLEEIFLALVGGEGDRRANGGASRSGPPAAPAGEVH